MILLLLVYYYKFDINNYEICQTNLQVDWDDKDTGGYLESNVFKKDLYNLKLNILAKYFGCHFLKDSYENTEKFELMFEDFFKYNYWTIPK